MPEISDYVALKKYEKEHATLPKIVDDGIGNIYINPSTFLGNPVIVYDLILAQVLFYVNYNFLFCHYCNLTNTN